jgi:thiamine biosynthesis lipoprotein
MSPVEKSGIAMDTFVRVRAYGPGAGEAAAAALAEIQRLDALLDPYDESSEIAAVNRAAGTGAVRVSPETLEVVERALWHAERTGGSFDPTILPLVKAWGFPTTPHIPGPEKLGEALSLVDYRLVAVDRSNSTLSLGKKGMCLDLGGIAKGYAVDRAAAVLVERGIRSALIEAGGNVYALGMKPAALAGSTSWRVGIQHPRDPAGLVATVTVSGQSVVTSGDYQRFFEAAGVRYHHLLDPGTGQPARSFMSVTVIGPSSTDADALSTAVFVMGERAGLDLLRTTRGFGAVAVRADGTTIVAGEPPGRVDLAGGTGR